METQQHQAPAPRPLRRSAENKMLGGVAAGVADWLGIDPTLARLGFAALTITGGLGVPLYLAAWVLIPEERQEQSIAEELLDRSRLV